jgi:hypothetical protein
LAARTDRPNEVAVQFDRLVAVGLGDLAQRQGGACAVATRIRHQIEPVEIKPGVAVQQEKIVAQPRQRVDQSPAGASRRWWREVAPEFRTTGLVGGSLLRKALNGAEHDEDETED